METRHDMTDSYRVELDLTYEGVNISRDIAPYLLSFRYTDHGTGKADDLRITLQDREGKWRLPWMPQTGDSVTAAIVLLNADKPGSRKSVSLGSFEVDQLVYGGPPDTLQVGAVAFPLGTGMKVEEKTKAWEKTTLRQIAESIARTAGLRLQFETDNVSYDRIDQTQQTDIAFLAGIAEKEGATVKITNGALVIFDDRKFENQKPVRIIERGKSLVKTYTFEHSVVGAAYAACNLTYYDSVKARTITGTYRIPGASGPILKIQERVESEAEAIRVARNTLRQRNRDAQRARFTLVGDPGVAQGVTVAVKGYGRFDAVYFIETATHAGGSSGYETILELRKVLTF